MHSIHFCALGTLKVMNNFGQGSDNSTQLVTCKRYQGVKAEAENAICNIVITFIKQKLFENDLNTPICK